MHLSKIHIFNYKGIDELSVSFSPKINIIIGENGCRKSALIDAIRLLYNLGEPIREISVSNEDFYQKTIVKENGEIGVEEAEIIKIIYEFRGLNSVQKGAFYEYMVVDQNDHENDFARIEISYKKDKRYPIFSFNTGGIDGQKADTNTFRLFQHYYLSALRDSTKDLMHVKNNILGKVIKRHVDRLETEDEIKEIIKDANAKLLKRDEVIQTRDGININLTNIFKKADNNQIGLQIQQSRIEYIVNAIKPYLPHDFQKPSTEGFQLWQNSLGFNNLIYIATVLGDLKERIADDAIPHYALMIEEPEAHIHPQLQLSLFSFLKHANEQAKSQLFITTHSPTLTSKVPFENLILLDKKAYPIDYLFKERAEEKIIQDTRKNTELTQPEIDNKKNQLQRYIDVTKSQLFFAKSCLLVEGISEELLITSFCMMMGFNLEDYRIEMVNVDGISFYPFQFLFNSNNADKRLPKKISILTDDDRFTDAKQKEYNPDNLIKDGFKKLIHLTNEVMNGKPKCRVNNIRSVSNNRSEICVSAGRQTLEFELCLANIPTSRTAIRETFLYKFLLSSFPGSVLFINAYLNEHSEELSVVQQNQVAVLLWKSLPSKAEFAQNFSLHIINSIDEARAGFKIPEYISNAITHLIK